MESKSRKLRSGFTTGACAAAAAKAATLLFVRSSAPGVREEIQSVEIPFPDGSRVMFKVRSSALTIENAKRVASASIIKDAGDDPDVTNGAEISALVRSPEPGNLRTVDSAVIIKGGKGVGTVTKPGLAVPVGEAAINPVPRKMIREAVQEAVVESGVRVERLEVTISVPAGEALAKKTLNSRLGITGGISILGTTGIVRPVSTEAYTASITASLDVAQAAGLDTVVLSSGRTSERAHMKAFHLPEEAYVMMGDYVEFALEDAKRHRFKSIHLCAQWAKLVKTAMGTPQTHVRHGALEAGKAAHLLMTLGVKLPQKKIFNTTREIFDFIYSTIRNPQAAMKTVCATAQRYAEGITSGIPVTVHLVSYEGEILAASK